MTFNCSFYRGDQVQFNLLKKERSQEWIPTKLENGTTYFGKLIMKKTLRIYFKSILHFHRTYDLSSISCIGNKSNNFVLYYWAIGNTWQTKPAICRVNISSDIPSDHTLLYNTSRLPTTNSFEYEFIPPQMKNDTKFQL